MLIAEAEATDIVSHCTELPPVIMTVPRDQAYMTSMSLALVGFVERMLEQRELLNKRYGPFPLPRTQAPPEPFGVTMEDAERIIAHWDR
jgi:hypothetical protein